MTAEIIGGSTVAPVYLCPECGSPSLTYPHEFGVGVAECGSCEWSGRQDEMLVAPVVHMEGSKENIVSRLTGDMRILLSRPKFGKPFVRFLLKWGFVEQPINPKTVGRYFAVTAVAVLTAIIKERQKMEKERANGS